MNNTGNENKTQIVHNEDLEGYYEVVVPIVNVKKDPGTGKRNETVMTLMKTQVVTCNGDYCYSEGSKWYLIEFDGKSGFVNESKIKTL